MAKFGVLFDANSGEKILVATIRSKLNIWIVGIVLASNLILLWMTVSLISRELLREVQTRVRLDLNSARKVYNSYLDRKTQFLRGLSLNKSIQDMVTGQQESMHSNLSLYAKEGGFDWFHIFDKSGHPVAVLPGSSALSLSENIVLTEALRTKKTTSGTMLIPVKELARVNPKLSQQVQLEIKDTPSSYKTKEAELREGMVLAVAVPVLGEQEAVVAYLFGALLLNQRFELVDLIKKEVFQNQTSQGREIGTATIFQGNVRISTNVRTSTGERALGTRLSKEVHEVVLKRAEVWADRAFVVNDWYITAYEPIVDPTGSIIGALYVGLLEEPYLNVSHRMTTYFIIFLFFVTVMILGATSLLLKQLLSPITRVAETAQKVIDGDLSARTGISPQGETGVLCRSFDAMAQAVEQREESLKQAARETIGASQKHAAVGLLAAGIAHEINNPLTGVLTFSNLLMEKDNLTEQDREDLEVIVHETTRVREIVQGLLDFARESPTQKAPVVVNEVIRETVRLVQNQKEFRSISMLQELRDDLPVLQGDKNRLKQVLLNLLLNACEAMPEGGRVIIRTQSAGEDVIIEVEDTGHGMNKETLDKIFDPFFSTKSVGKGTGLGLSVSYGIVRQHGGVLKASSEEGRGTTFTILLPKNYKVKDDSETERSLL